MHHNLENVEDARRQLIGEIETSLPSCDGHLATRIAAEQEALQSGSTTPEALELSAWRLRNLAQAMGETAAPVSKAAATLIIALGGWVSGG